MKLFEDKEDAPSLFQTTRDRVATAAMTGIIATRSQLKLETLAEQADAIAKAAYKIADAMIKEQQKKKRG